MLLNGIMSILVLLGIRAKMVALVSIAILVIIVVIAIVGMSVIRVRVVITAM